jgi:sugar/nucleoside kinase (ribokinase family)
VRSRFVGGLVAVLAVGGLVGCGGDDEPGAEKQRYIEQSDTICRETFAKTEALTARDQQTAERASAEWAAAYDKLNALPVPGEDFEQARQFVTDVNNLAMSYTAAARALGLNDQEKANRAFNDVDMIKRRAAERAEDYEYFDCAGIAQA